MNFIQENRLGDQCSLKIFVINNSHISKYHIDKKILK